MHQRQMNRTMLSVILATQAYKQFALRDNLLHEDRRDWTQVVEDYFMGLPDEVHNKAHLNKNLHDLEAVLRFEVTDEILDSPPGELGHFSFFSYSQWEASEEPEDELELDPYVGPESTENTGPAPGM